MYIFNKKKLNFLVHAFFYTFDENNILWLALFFKKNSSCKQASKTSLINHLPSTIYKKKRQKTRKKNTYKNFTITK